MSHVMSNSQSKHELSAESDECKSKSKNKRNTWPGEEESLLDPPQWNNLLICGNSMSADIKFHSIASSFLHLLCEIWNIEHEKPDTLLKNRLVCAVLHRLHLAE